MKPTYVRIAFSIFFLSASAIASPAGGNGRNDPETRYIEAVEQTLIAPSDTKTIRARAEAALELIAALLPLDDDGRVQKTEKEMLETAQTVYEETWAYCFPAAQKDRSLAQSLAVMTRHVREHPPGYGTKETYFSRMKLLVETYPDDTVITLEASKAAYGALRNSLLSWNFSANDREQQESREFRSKADMAYGFIATLPLHNPDGARQLHLQQVEAVSAIIEAHRERKSPPTEEEKYHLLSLPGCRLYRRALSAG